MSKIIRWPGLIAFVVIVALICGIVVTFANPLLRMGLSSALTQANGAEVNIEQAELNWRPFGVVLTDMQFTDPDQPELNRVQASRVSADINFWDAVIGRIHITDLQARGIAMGTERERPGKVRADYRAEREPFDWRQRLADLDIELPSVDDVLERGDIRTPALAEKTEQDFREYRERLERARENLPSEEQFESYKERIDALIDRDLRNPQQILTLRNDLSSLKDDMRSDRAAVQEFLDLAEEAVTTLRDDLQALRDAPGHDLERLRSLFAMDRDSLSELTGVLFGEQVQEWSQYAMMAFDFIAPLLQGAEEEARPSRWEGRFIDFDEGRRPVFLIDQALTDILLGSTELSVEWRNLTWQHDRINERSVYELVASESPWWNTLNLDGNFAFSEVSGFSGEQGWQLAGAQLPEQTLVEQSQIVARLLSAALNSEGRISADAGDLGGRAQLHFNNVAMEAMGDATWVRLLNEALSGVRQFDMNVDLAGVLRSPQFRISSDLDNQLGNLLQNAVRQEADQRLANVRQDLNQRVSEVTGEWGPQLERFTELRSMASDRQALLAEWLDIDAETIIQGNQESLEDRLRDSLRRRLGGNR